MPLSVGSILFSFFSSGTKDNMNLEKVCYSGMADEGYLLHHDFSNAIPVILADTILLIQHFAGWMMHG